MAQPAIPLHHLGRAEHLSNTVNQHVYCDSKGFVWISSMDGLNRFDGVKSIIYRPEWQGKKVVENFITGGFFEDKNSNIWFGTMNFIGCYIRERDSVALYNIQDNGENIKNNVPFYLEDNGTLWLRSDFGVFTFSTAKKTWKKISQPDGYNRCRLSAFDKSNFLLYAFDSWEPPNAISIYRVKDGRITDTFRLMVDQVGTVIDLISVENHLWIASAEKGLIEADLNGKNLHFYGREEARVSAIKNICRKGDSLIVSDWSNHLFFFDLKKKQLTGNPKLKYGTALFGQENQINALYADHLNNLWISSWKSGIFYGNLNKSKINELPLPAGEVKKGNYKSFVEDLQGNYWCILNDKQLIKYRKDMTVARIYNTQKGIKADLLVRIFCDKEGSIWVLAREGIFRYREMDDQFENIIPTPNNMGCHYISQLHDGNLLLSSRNEGLYLLNTTTVVLTKVNLERKYQKAFTTTFQDSKGRVFAVLNDEKILAFEYASGRFKAITEIPLSGEFNAFMEITTDNTIWIASSMGLIRLNSQDLTKYSIYDEKDGLANPYIQHVLVDRNGLFWVTTNNGISSYDRRQHCFRNYSLADGVAGYEFVSGSGLYDAQNDLLLLGSTEGANYFYPGRLTNLPLLPYPQITGLRYNDKYPMKGFSSTVKKAVFTYAQNTLNFDFVSIDYADPANNRVAYRLKGYDSNWDTLSTPSGNARYAQLREGTYTFQVIGANSDGVWNHEPRTIEVEILPPFYRTWWFYLLEILALAGLIGGGVKLYVDGKLRAEKIKQEKLAALQKERDRIASEMHDDVGAGLTSIRLISDRIQRQVQDPQLQQQINRITLYAGDLIENMSSIIWAMNSSNDTYEGLYQYLRKYALEYLTETNSLSASFPLTDSFPALPISGERRRQIFLAFKESLHNIIKHAGAATVAIRVVFEKDIMKIEIADDGKGIPADRKNGNGLVNMQKRLENIGGHFSTKDNNPHGTIVQFDIPVQL